MALPWTKFLNLVWVWALKRLQPEQREEWIAMMNEPMPHRALRETPQQLEDEMDAFLAFHNGGGR